MCLIGTKGLIKPRQLCALAMKIFESVVFFQYAKTIPAINAGIFLSKPIRKGQAKP